LKIDLSNIESNNFEQFALEVFQFQAESIPIYKAYLKELHLDPKAIQSIEDIPFLPISFFKTHRIAEVDRKEEIIFTSSGTSGLQTSKHFVTDLSVYKQSFRLGFQHFYGNITDYCVLALLPSYLEREGSSLIMMAEDLIDSSGKPDSGFYLHNTQELIVKLRQLEANQQRTLLLGVSYALLDLIEKERFELKHTIIMETGGMKGQRKEMIKEEFYKVLTNGFGLKNIHSEYGMTELLSQAYSKGSGEYYCPPWMQVKIRDINDPFFEMSIGKSGGINIIDLANINSCSFIATQDLGRINKNGSFSILGRFDHSDTRGCNLMIN
jgi:phenylacetate-coenzyme A ligase PaaK-like adenylate-forming protein